MAVYLWAISMAVVVVAAACFVGYYGHKHKPVVTTTAVTDIDKYLTIYPVSHLRQPDSFTIVYEWTDDNDLNKIRAKVADHIDALSFQDNRELIKLLDYLSHRGHQMYFNYCRYLVVYSSQGQLLRISNPHAHLVDKFAHIELLRFRRDHSGY